MDEYSFSILNFRYVLRKYEKEANFLTEFGLFRNGYDVSIWTFQVYTSYSNGHKIWELIDDIPIPSFQCDIDCEAYNKALQYLKKIWDGKEA